ncbi:hypothetical protein [Flavobacterium sp. J27]|uniref:hypothetical protein n=1 Tax=Flavobacterium sp. J27 TaxID=2060419 RepID=UPI0010303246|nr:hypothetical protein [Flavobacterium sp. J27]
MKNIYKHYIPLRLLFFIELISGTVILTFFMYLFKNDIYPNMWSFAGPLLSIALIINGLTSFKINEINSNTAQQYIEINKESLFSSKSIKIKFKNLKTELKTGNGKKKSIIPKLRVIILDSDKEMEELNSNFLGFNNSQLRKLYSSLKDIAKQNLSTNL